MIILGAVGLSADPTGPISGPVTELARTVGTVVVANPLPVAAVSVLLLLGALVVVLAVRTRERQARTELVSRSLAEARAEREGSVR